MTAPLRLGLIGCGRLAEAGYLPAIGRTAAFDLVAVADPDPARRDRLAALGGDGAKGRLAGFADGRALVAGAGVDAVIVASPAGAHLADAAAAATAGVAALVEKPPAPDAAAAADLAALDPAPWIGFNRRFDAAARAVRDRVPPSGDLDVDLTIHFRRRSWAAVAVHDEVLVDLGPHLVDWSRWLTRSEVVEVDEVELAPDRAQLTLRLERGTVRIDAAADRLHREEIVVRSGGDEVARHTAGGPIAAVTGRLGGGPHPLVTSLAAQLAAFAAAVRGGAAPELGTALDGVAVMTVLDTARAAAARRGPHAVPAPTRS